MKLKQRLQHMLIDLKARGLTQEQYEFPRQIQLPNRILITLPEGIETNSVLLRIISELPATFPSSELLIVVPKGCTEVMRKTGIHAMSPDLYSANILGLPKRNFFAKVKAFEATMLIDFETHRNVFNAMVAVWSGARLRIGISNVWDMPVHNFVVKSDFITDELKVYRSLVDIISDIQTKSSQPGGGPPN